VTIDGGFWGDRQAVNATAMIPHVDHWLEKLRWTSNFDRAVDGTVAGDRAGREFSDSEIYKLLEGMAWEIGRTGDAALEARFAEIAARVEAAQEADGYLNTQFGREGQRPRYSDFEWGHELYCFGHLIQAGVARARTAGLDDAFVQMVIRAADHVCREFGADGRQDIPGHPEIETALVELFRVTGQQKYLDQATLFIDRRGHGHLGVIDFGQQYFQDNVPVRQATVFDGHAVRALYLAAGAADLAVETGDSALHEAVVGQTLTTLARRTYLTGGMGAHHEGESFGEDYELPPDRSYSETCAGIASVMLNHRLLMQTGDARHADAIERTLFNIVATSPAADGKGFYYTNVLQQRVEGLMPDPDEPSFRAAAAERPPFFAVSCCPTNLTRTFATLGAYIATHDGEGVQVHQYAPATIRASLASGDVTVRMTTSYPDAGRIEVTVAEAAPGPWTLTLRIPSWAVATSAGSGATLTTADGQTRQVAPGYVSTPGPVAPGASVVLDLPVAARWTYADPRIDAVRGQVAVERGPVVMALESVDLGADVATARVRTDAPPVDDGHTVQVPVTVVDQDDDGWPYGGYRPGQTQAQRLVSLIPYHSWAERGPSTMRIFIPEERA
jgi:DUF1680 family protein